MKNFMILVIGILIGALAMYFYCCQSNEEKVVSSAPKGLITPDQAKSLDLAYNPRYKLISDSLVTRKGGDNRSSWYGLDQVRNYLNYAEREAEKLGYTMDGVRIYLGAHPDQNGEAGYTTMFFIPTGKSHKAEASMLNFSMQSGGGDIPGAGGMDLGSSGNPPRANYPQ
ncbi:hypothetical protein [Gelidibacter sp.]|uniref:hypothetical protein n=1 Tax=Gelidibacter sp. TaxID=2018083 RepID=UPI0032672A08